MQSNSKEEGRKKGTVIVNPSTIDLEAEWEPSDKRWIHVVAGIVTRSRHQASILAYVAVLGAMKLAEVRAGDKFILSIVILAIVIVAIFSEWAGKESHGNSRQKTTP